MQANNWQTRKLSELCDIDIGKTPSRSNLEYWNGSLKWVSISDMKGKFITQTKECITEKGAKESNSKLVPENTLLMSFKLSIGKLAFTTEPVYTNEAIASLKIKDDDVITNEYLYYVLQTIDLTAGSDKAVKGLTLNKAKLNELKIPYPSKEEQEKIVSILDKADEIRAKKKLANDKLDEFLKSTFISMFGDPVKNSKFFKVDKLEKYIKVLGGYAFKSNLFKESGIPVLRIGNINTGKLKMDNVVYWDDDASLSKYKLYPKDIVISLTGTVGKDDYGNVCILPSTCPCYYLNQRNAKLVVNRDVINIYYLCHLLKNKEVKSKLTNISRGVRQANISNSDILNLEVVIPPIEDQNKFSQIVEHVEAQKQKNELVIEQMNNLFNSLSQRAFKGKL